MTKQVESPVCSQLILLFPLSNLHPSDKHITTRKRRKANIWHLHTLKIIYILQSTNVWEHQISSIKSEIQNGNGAQILQTFPLSRKKQPIIVYRQCSGIAVSEQVATRYPICVRFCCFGPVTSHSSGQYQSLQLTARFHSKLIFAKRKLLFKLWQMIKTTMCIYSFKPW